MVNVYCAVTHRFDLGLRDVRFRAWEALGCIVQVQPCFMHVKCLYDTYLKPKGLECYLEIVKTLLRMENGSV